MTFDALRAYCLGLPGTTEDQPFGPDVLVFKVKGKLFALLNLDGPPFSVNLKCDPEKAIELRERYAAVVPGYHMNKQHWNTVDLAGDASSEDLRAWIDDSYRLVVQSLKKADREALM